MALRGRVELALHVSQAKVLEMEGRYAACRFGDSFRTSRANSH